LGGIVSSWNSQLDAVFGFDKRVSFRWILGAPSSSGVGTWRNKVTAAPTGPNPDGKSMDGGQIGMAEPNEHGQGRKVAQNAAQPRNGIMKNIAR